MYKEREIENYRKRINKYFNNLKKENADLVLISNITDNKIFCTGCNKLKDRTNTNGMFCKECIKLVNENYDIKSLNGNMFYEDIKPKTLFKSIHRIDIFLLKNLLAEHRGLLYHIWLCGYRTLKNRNLK